MVNGRSSSGIVVYDRYHGTWWRRQRRKQRVVATTLDGERDPTPRALSNTAKDTGISAYASPGHHVER
jgi:hypothetical protein